MKKQNSLRWKIACYLLIFAAFVLAVMGVFQFFLLKPMYEDSKVETVKEVADNIAAALKTDDLSESIYENQARSDTCILVYQDSSSGQETYDHNRSMGCMLYRLDPSAIGNYVANARTSGDGTYLTSVSMNFDAPDGSDSFRNIIYTKIVNQEDRVAVIMVSTGVSPISAAIQTLRTQMFWIAGLILFGIAVLTIVLYRDIARPLTEINAAAKDLSKGEYETNPGSNRYIEAQELNNTLEQAAKDIHKADKAKRDLISNVSHDLRTPLTMISGYGEMMRDLPEEKTDENLQVIIDESKRLNALVNDLLDLSRLQDKRIELHCVDFNLTELIMNQLKKYDVYRLQEDYKIESQLEENLQVHADPKRIEQVFNNFMTNAVNYGGEAKHIIIRAVRKEKSAHVEVQDFGEGIDEKDLPNVWDRYYKVDKEHVRAVNGSGIGLSIVKEVLDLHHAEYGVHSKKGEGSTFWFELPLAEEDKKDENKA